MWERVVGPIGVPLAALTLTAFIVICVSRVLLAVSKDASVAVALVLAILILLGFWFLASRPRSNKAVLGILGGTAAISLAAAGIAGASSGERTFEEHEVAFNVTSLTAKNTQLGFQSTDLDQDMADLRERGVVFEEYDFPGLKTENGVATMPSGERGAWFLDTEGNILSISTM